MSTERITDDLQRLLALLPTAVQEALAPAERRDQLLEVVLDLGRVPEARYPGRSVELGGRCLEHCPATGFFEVRLIRWLQ